MREKVIHFLKGDIVLAVSICLAVCSCVVVPPSIEYLDYIDFRTLILLFCLMLIIGGLRELNFFEYIGKWILDHAKSRRGILVTLVFLCFVSSMFITNDVALITFVPFGIMILRNAGMTFITCRVVTLMTIAANLGSMFTPIGNPQNLYLFSLSGFSITEFLMLMLLAAALLAGVYVVAGITDAICFGADFHVPYLTAENGTVQVGSSFLYVLEQYLLNSVGMFAMTTMAFMISSLLKSSAVAIGVGVAALMGGSMVTQILAQLGCDWGRYLIFANMNLGQIRSGYSVFPNQSVTFAAVTLIVYMVIFLWTAFDGFTRREV